MLQKNFIESLNKIKLKNLSGVKVGNFLNTIYTCEKTSTTMRNIKFLISGLFLRNWKYEKKGNGNILFLFSHAYASRQDMQTYFDNVVSCSRNVSVLRPRKIFSIKINRFKLLGLLFKWRVQLNSVNLGSTSKWFIAIRVFLAYCALQEGIEISFNKSRPKLLVSFCDTHIEDYLFTWYANKHGIPTATLQHGVMVHDEPYDFWCSHSKYLLASSKHTLDEAVKCGYSTKHMLILGSMNQIQNPAPKHIVLRKNKIFGIVLTGGGFDEEDKELMNAGLELMNKLKLHPIIRPHPGHKAPFHELLVNKLVNISINEPISLFLSHCDFVIVGRSAVFSEAFLNGCPAYRYVKYKERYDNINFYKYQIVSELLSQIEDYYCDNTKNIFQCVRYYFLSVGNVRENYRNFFRYFGG